jgi:hypothetical protein
MIDRLCLNELPELARGELLPLVCDNCLCYTMLGEQFTTYCHSLPGRRARHWNNIGILGGVHSKEVPSQMWISEGYVNVPPRFAEDHECSVALKDCFDTAAQDPHRQTITPML